MKRTFKIIALLLVLLCDVATAKDIYGPKTVDVDGKRTKFTEEFIAKDGTKATLIIINGFDGPRAKSVKVVLNGSKLVARKQVNSSVRSFTNGITLNKKNSIKIIVKGSGASVLIRIVASQRNLLDRVVSIGDSLTAGMQDNTLVEERQVWSYPAQIADSAMYDFVLPLISEPGIPAREIDLVNGNLVRLDPQAPGQRINPEEQAHNLAVPGAAVSDVLNTESSTENSLYKIVLGGKETMIEQVERLDPTFVLMWIGSNDVLGMVLNTDPAQHTDINEFRDDYETLLQRLTANGNKVVAANIVDITEIPYLIEATDFGRSSDDRVTVIDWLAFLLGEKSSVTEDEVLTPSELAAIRTTVDEFNDAIEELCGVYGVPLLDARALFDELHANGLAVAGTTLTTRLLEGIFSLDAVHPSNTGQAAVANEFIKLINREFGKNIPAINLEDVYLADPLQQNSISLRRGIATVEKSTLESLRRIIEKQIPTRFPRQPTKPN